jgi:arylsulfatase A-like enzyme
MVLNVDLAPTFLDLAGLPVPSEIQGRSWRPLLTTHAPEWRKAFLAEYFLENAFPGTPTVVAVRTADAKLIKYPGHDEWTELFDLARDPYEIKNLVADPAHKDLLARMQAEFDQQVKLSRFAIPDYADKPGAADQPAGKKPGKKKKKQAAAEG